MRNSLDPNQYHELRAILRSIGPAIAGIGLLLTIVGIASFVRSFGTFEPPHYFWCAVVGLPLVGVGIMISKFAYIGTITRYISGEVAPVGKDVTNYMVAETKDSIRDVTTAVGEGFAAAGVVGGAPRVRCHKCNADNDVPANFCDRCGAPLAKTKKCEKCGELNDPDARFCDHCGTAVT